MKKIMYLIVVLASVLVGTSFASTEEQRRIDYALTALDAVTTANNWMWREDVEGGWTNNSVPFVNGVADSFLDLPWGPGIYDAGCFWTDKNGYSLFHSRGSAKRIEFGMNYMDFPMSISYWRYIRLNFKGVDVTRDSGVWANGNRAWWNGECWVANIGTPWNVTNLTVLVEGQGRWSKEVTPIFNWGDDIVFDVVGIDRSVTVPAQAFGISYLAELSYPEEQVVSGVDQRYDETIGASVLVCQNSLYAKYGTFKVMVTLEYYDKDVGNNVQYFSRYVEVTDGEFLIPLINLNGGGLGIYEGTTIRFIYADPSAGGVYKQQYDYTLYWRSGSDGKGVKGEPLS